MSQSQSSPDRRRGILGELHVVPPEALVVFGGEIDLDNLDQLRSILALVVDIDVRTVTVDLTRVGFTSLGALHALVDAAADLERHGGRLTLLGTTPLQDRVLALLDAPAALVIAPDPVG